MTNYFNNKKRALQIAVIYVGFATLTVCSVYPADLFYGEWCLFGLMITFPVSIISFGYRYADVESLYPVFIIQFVMLVLTFLVLSTFIKDKNP
jgi:hypothetical protein